MFIWKQIILQSTIIHKQQQKELFNKIVESDINNIALPYTAFLINPFLI